MTVRMFRSTEVEPRRRGQELGSLHRAEVRQVVEAYRRLFLDARRDDLDIDALGQEAYDRIAEISPALAIEIEGIAEGSGSTIAEIAAINARTEILALAHRGAAKNNECSTVVHVGEPGNPVAVQAWDWYDALADLWFVWEIPQADGTVVRTLTEYGIVGKIGVNGYGLGVLFNILHHADDGQRIGTPVHVLARSVLDGGHDLNQALLLLSQASVSASSSLTLVAATGKESAAVSVELNPASLGFALPDEHGLLIHTNHFLSSPAQLGDTELRNGPDSVVRYDLLHRRLAGRARIAPRDVVEAMNSHILGGGGLCCHPDPALPPQSQFRTLATVVMNAAAGTLHAASGGACTHPLLTDPTTYESENLVLNLKRIDNMDILTRDVSQLVDFYHGTLGLPFHLPYEPAEEWAAIDLGNLTLYIFKSEVGEHEPRRTAVNADNAPGYDSMAFEVDDLDAAESALDGWVEWVDERIEWKHPSGAWYRYRPFFDPDGNMVYITEPHRA